MALSSVSYLGDGSQTEFNVTIPYLSRSHMSVLLDDVPTSAWSWTSDTMIELDDPPANGVVVKIKRTTPSTARLVGFQRGATLDADADLDADSNQLMYLLQELSEGSLATVIGDTQIEDGAITTAKFNPAAKAPFAGAADTAAVAALAAEATHAASADLATEATHATSADEADEAVEANHALTADEADVADLATAVDTDGVNTAAIQDDAVTNVEAANMAAGTIKLRPLGAGTGDPVDGTAAQAAAILRDATMRFNSRAANAPRAVTTGKGLKYLPTLDKILTIESGGSLRVLEINRVTDHLISRMTLGGKTPGSWCYTGTLIWCANGTTNIFAIDPSGWTNPTSAAASRCDRLLFNSVDGFVYGFDDGVTPAIKKIDATAGTVSQTTTTGLANGICVGTEYPWALDPVSNCIYHFDAFGQVRKFNCASQAVTSITAVTAFGSGNQSMVLGTDGYLYLVSDIGTDKQKITVLDPATDTVVTTIDLSAYLANASALGFTSINLIQGHLYASMASTESTSFGAILVIRLSDYAVVGCLNSYGIAGAITGSAVGTVGQDRLYAAIGILNETAINAFDR